MVFPPALLLRLTRRLKTVSFGIVIAICAGLLLPAMFGGAILTAMRQEQMTNEMENLLRGKLELLANSLGNPLWNVDRGSVKAIVEATLLDTKVVRVTVTETDGSLFMAEARAERRLGRAHRRETTLVHRGDPVGKVEIELDDSQLAREFERDRHGYYLVLLGQFVFALVLSLVSIRHRVLLPLARLTVFSDQIAGGNLDQPLRWTQSDEIGHLAQQLDEMRRALQASFAEQQESQLALTRQNALLSSLTESLPIGVLMVEAPSGKMLMANSVARSYADTNTHVHFAESTIEDSYRQLKLYKAGTNTHYPSDQSPLLRGMRGENSRIDDMRCIRPDGSEALLEVFGSPVTDEHGAVWASLVCFSDITERKRAEERLKLLASVFSHAREAIMITAPDGTIIDVNGTFSRLTGFSRDEAIGKPPGILHSDRQDDLFYEKMWRDLTTQGHWDGELWSRRKNGEDYPQLTTISAVRDSQGVIQQFVALFSDISDLKAYEKQLEHMAHYDVLTTLPNRVLLGDRLNQAMIQTQRRGQLLAVAYLDLDGFKAINDSHGHLTGDHFLVALAERMKQSLREGDTLARLGGDEFVAVLLDLPNTAACIPMLSRLLASAARPVELDDLSLQVSASLGVTFFPQHDDVDADQLLRQADQAMYQAKLAGKDRYYLFDADQDRAVRGHHESLVHLRRALREHEFVLYYQPKVNMRTGTVIGAEALIRWQHPERGLLSPAAFLPFIEDHQLSVEIGEWVLDAALTQLQQWHSQGLALPVSVNIGARQLQQVDFVDRLRAILDRYPALHPGDLTLEILETSALKDIAQVSRIIEESRQLGVRFALDDFGTGYSSLTYLKRLTVDQLKIDQSFVRDMLDDPDDLAILQGILGLASAFQREVIAEGVETVEHGEMLLHMGCVHAQGYGIARPMPADALPAWQMDWRPARVWRNARQFDRTDLPLLAASVQHRAWFARIEQHLRDPKNTAPETDVSQCYLGQWMEGDASITHGMKPSFQTLYLLHLRLHALAEEASAYCDDRPEEAQAHMLLDEMRTLHESLLQTLKTLEREESGPANNEPHL